MEELAQVQLGTDRFRAYVIAEACRAAGLKVKLLTSDDSGYANIEPHRLLVRSADLEQVAAVIDKSDDENRRRQ
jgi:hypothetical protein